MSKLDYLDSQRGQDRDNPFNLPSLCYVHVPGQPIGRHIGIVKRGELGYFPAPGMTMAAADKKNAVMDVSHEQREAMSVGSMFGWTVPGANPAKYTGTAGPICADTRAVEIEADAIKTGDYER